MRNMRKPQLITNQNKTTKISVCLSSVLVFHEVQTCIELLF